MTDKFRNGDRVKILKDGIWTGRFGQVIALAPYTCMVYFPSAIDRWGNTEWFYFHELQKVEW